MSGIIFELSGFNSESVELSIVSVEVGFICSSWVKELELKSVIVDSSSEFLLVFFSGTNSVLLSIFSLFIEFNSEFVFDW